MAEFLDDLGVRDAVEEHLVELVADGFGETGDFAAAGVGWFLEGGFRMDGLGGLSGLSVFCGHRFGVLFCGVSADLRLRSSSGFGRAPHPDPPRPLN